MGDTWTSLLADDYYGPIVGGLVWMVAAFVTGRLFDELRRRDAWPTPLWNALAMTFVLLAIPGALVAGVSLVYGFMNGHWVGSVVGLVLIGLAAWAVNNWENIARLFPRFGRFVSWLAR